MTIRKETRPERDDVFSFFTTESVVYFNLIYRF